MPGGTSNPPEGRKPTRGDANTSRPLTRYETRRTGTAVTAVANEDVRDAAGARSFLEERLLLCPPGELATHASLATCLHQVSKMSGIGALAASAVRSVAILLEEMEDTAINETVRDAVISQFNELTLDMRNLVTDVKEKIDTHMQQYWAVNQPIK